MGKRGPAPDLTQAAKGNPGRRRSKAEKDAEHAAKISAMLAPVDGAADLPPMLQDAKYAAAAQVWRRLAPELKRTHRLPRESENYLVMLCIYAQEWVSTTDDLHTKGFSQSIKTVAGGRMERRRPMTLDRQQAYNNLMDLSAKFGLTPHDMYGLFKDQRLAVERNPDMFDAQRQDATPAAAPADETGASPASRVGSLSRHRSTPPGGRPN